MRRQKYVLFIVMINLGILTACSPLGNDHVSEGWKLYNNGDYQGAVAEFSQDNSAEAFNGLGWTYYKLGNLELAKTNFNNAISMKTEYPDALQGLGIIYFDEKDYEKSNYYYGEIIKYDPTSVTGYSGIGINYFWLGHLDESEDMLQRSILLGTTDDKAYRYYAIILDRKGQHQEALAYGEKSIELNPTDYNNWEKVGWTYVELGNYEEAEKAFQEAKKYNDNSPNGKYGLAYVYCAQERYNDGDIVISDILANNADFYDIDAVMALKDKCKEQ